MRQDRESIWPPWWGIAVAVAAPVAFLLWLARGPDVLLMTLVACTLGVVVQRPFSRLWKQR